MTDSTAAASPSISSDRAEARRAKARERWHRFQDRKRGADRNRISGRKPKLTTGQQEFLRKNYGALSLRALAQRLEVAPSTVRRYLHLWGMTVAQTRSPEPLPPTRPENKLAWWEG